MARFNWQKFLERYRIPYVTAGPNVGRGNINCKCPFCGEADPSEHMGLSPQGWFGCLRNSAHRGRSPHRLVRQLLRCSEDEAARIIGTSATLAPTADELESSATALRSLAGQEAPPAQKLTLPKEFKPLLNGSPLATPFLHYLRQRGFRDAQIKWLGENYGLCYATTGLYAQRIVVPIYDRYGDLLSWTARALSPEAQPRYRTLRVRAEVDDGQPVAKLPSNHTVLGLPVLWGADNPRALILVEGPFDALKVTAFGHSFGVYAAALFGLNVYPAQVSAVLALAQRFDAVYLLLDEDAELQRLRLLQALSPTGCKVLKMPENTDDPGALSGSEVVDLCLNLAA